MQPVLRRALMLWLPIAVAVTGVAGVTFVAVQQALRLGANDPQIQMAEDAAARLATGVPAASIVPAETVELSASLRPFVMVFDRDGALVASSATLNGAPPPFPPSVLRGIPDGRQDRITWQPAPGVRSAVVVQTWPDGFVVAGRSLRAIEERIDKIQVLSAMAWLFTLGATAVAAVVGAAAYDLPRLARGSSG